MKSKPIIEIDPNAGFCFGVVRVIEIAEEILEREKNLYCLGKIVHNEKEIERLSKKGLITISYEEYEELKNCKVLIRAHGEPPQTYEIAKKNNITLIDGTCPVVTALQRKIQNTYNKVNNEGGQIVIYGKKDHPEIIGIKGYINDNAIIIENLQDLENIDYSKAVYLFSQTTKNSNSYEEIKKEIEKRIINSGNKNSFFFNDTICKQVKFRDIQLREFCKNKDIIIFISGRDSSNGKMLYEECKKVNDNCYFITEIEQLFEIDFNNKHIIGISGATSTPVWLMEKAKEVIQNIIEKI